jgi:hypothetical protein
MQDRRLVAIVVCALVLVTLHLADHVFRGDLRLPLSSESLLFVVVSLVIYGVLGTGLSLYAKNKVGPRFWTIISVLGLGFGWLSHFSPYTDQNTKVIQGALPVSPCRMASAHMSPYLDVGVDCRRCLRRLSVDARDKAASIDRQASRFRRVSDGRFPTLCR